MDNKRYLKGLQARELQYLAKGFNISDRKSMGYKGLVAALKDIEDIQEMPKNQAQTYTMRLLNYWDRKYQGTLKNHTHSHELTNETCGDWVKIEAIIVDGVFSHLQFTAAGCCLSECCAAITIEVMRGKSLEYISNFTDKELFEVVKIKILPYRLKCVTLALNCLRLFNEET